MQRDDHPKVFYRADMGDGGGGGGGGGRHRTESVAVEPPADEDRTEVSETPPDEPPKGRENDAAKESTMPTKPAPSTEVSKERKAAALRQVRAELDAIAANSAWPLSLIAADVPGSRDLLSVAVGLAPAPDHAPGADPAAPWGLVKREVQLRNPDLRPLATVTYTGALDADATMRLAASGPDAVALQLKRLARALRSAQLDDALTELGVIPRKVRSLDPSGLNFAHRRLMSHGAVPITLVYFTHPARSISQWAARARVKTVDASGLGLYVATDRGRAQALMLGTESIELLRYLGHDLECAEAWKDSDDGLTIEVTERRLLHRTCESDRLLGIALA